LLAANRAFMAPVEPERPDDFYTVEGVRESLAKALADAKADRYYGYAILDEDGDVAGRLALAGVARGPLQSAVVGYWVDRERNGRGLATRAVAEVMDVAFGELHLHRLEAGTLVDNVASQRVLEKNGFARIGIAPRYLHVAGEWRDHVLFQRLADDRPRWRSIRSTPGRTRPARAGWPGCGSTRGRCGTGASGTCGSAKPCRASAARSVWWRCRTRSTR
jgi:ribosomal-protein-alanine N-acetyltransferase